MELFTSVAYGEICGKCCRVTSMAVLVSGISCFPRYEIYFYMFDALPMFLALSIMVITPPGLTLVGPDSVIPKAQWRQRWAMRKQGRGKETELNASGGRCGYELLRSE